jgi:hypothetical protein
MHLSRKTLEFALALTAAGSSMPVPSAEAPKQSADSHKSTLQDKQTGLSHE